MMTPIDFYKKQIATGQLLEDPQQFFAIRKLQLLYEHLIKTPQKKRGLMRRVKRNSDHNGIYLWGDVGIGKTCLIDAFYYCLPFQTKCRIHFYQFMQNVHESLHKLQGTMNPLRHIAREWGAKARVICFDELIVNDIADAMLLSELLQALLREGICLTFTSNVAPDDLYKNGLQRQSFLPAIQAIKEKLEVVHLSTQNDYRTMFANTEKYYWHPLTAENARHLENLFFAAAGSAAIQANPITVYDRKITIKASAGRNVWFEFKHICGPPRNSQDYLALCGMYDTVFISGVTPIGENQHDLARSFIQLVDVLYDAGAKLAMSGAMPIEEIYPHGKLSFEFERTTSRLKQMLCEVWL
jgi:cell division protein ZapE